MTESEFYGKLDEWLENDNMKTWTHITQLAHFLRKYEEKNGVPFRLVRCKAGPTMGKEASDFAKLFRTLAPDNYSKLKKDEKSEIRGSVNLKIFNYINWMFDYKFRRGKDSVNGTRLFLMPAIIVHFERMYDSYLRTKTSKSKIEELITWCKEEAGEVLDSHQLSREEDIKMIMQYANMYSLDESTPERRLITKALELGLI